MSKKNDIDEELSVFMNLDDPGEADKGIVEYITQPSEKNPLEAALDLPAKPVVKIEVIPAADGNDFNTARTGLHRVLGLAETALAEQATIARTSQSPRAYEVFNAMLKTTMEGYADLLELQKKNKDLTGTTPAQSVEGPKTVNNTLVLSSVEVLEMITNQMAGVKKSKKPIQEVEILPPDKGAGENDN
jgi:hypothetical protein